MDQIPWDLREHLFPESDVIKLVLVPSVALNAVPVSAVSPLHLSQCALYRCRTPATDNITDRHCDQEMQQSG